MIPVITKKASLTGHQGAVYSLSEGLGENMVLSCSGDKFLTQWNIDTCIPDSFSVKMQSVVYSSLFLKNKNQLLIGTVDGSLHVIDLDSKKEIKNVNLFFN